MSKKFNLANVDLFERQVESDSARLQKGEITLTDLAQSESSVSGAQAKFIKAKNETVTAKLVYEKIIGPVKNIEKLSKTNFGLRVLLRSTYNYRGLIRRKPLDS